MTLEKLIQTLKESGQSIADSVMAPKELKITKDVVIAESIKLTSKDIYRAYWHCRDFEITHLWQRSVFLTAFIVLCFSAYGCLAADMLSALRMPTDTPSDTYWLIAHGAAIFISLIGTALSLLWIMMAKASKAWAEVYECAIAAYEEDDNYINEMEVQNKIGSFQFDNLKDFKTKINEKKFSGCILKPEGGSLFAFQNQLGYRLGDIVHLDTIDIASYYWSILCRSMLGHRAYIDFSCLLCVTICCTNFLCKKQNPL